MRFLGLFGSGSESEPEFGFRSRGVLELYSCFTRGAGKMETESCLMSQHSISGSGLMGELVASAFFVRALRFPAKLLVGYYYPG